MKKKIIIIAVIIMVVIVGIVNVSFYQNHKQEEKKRLEEKQKEDERLTLETIKSNYNEVVNSSKNAKLYKLEGKRYKEIGQISKNASLTLEKIEELTLDNKYFKLANNDYYIYYNDVVAIDSKSPSNTDYKHYVPFDKEIITKNPTEFYQDGKIVYTINESMQFSIIIDNGDYYYIDFDNQLFGIKKENVEKIIEEKKNIATAEQIGVLNYHFFHDKSKGEICNEIICLDTAKFEQHLKYLKDNGFYTATMEDVSLWMRGKIKLPKKTAVITIDDGAMGTDTHLIRLLEKYDLHGTLFLITAWWPKDKYVSKNLEIQSHGYDIHTYNNGMAKALTMSHDALVNDFKKSIDALDGENTAFCYPFYANNETIRSAVKELGFKIAFAGGNTKASRNNDPYQIRRYVIYSYTTLDQFINMVN